MQNLELWKLAVDLLLMMSLVYLCFRVLRSGSSSGLRSNQFIELEGSLRVLIKEAEDAGRILNDQLLKRQQGLEKSLIDAGGVESRIQRAMSSAEEAKGLLEVEVARARSLQQGIGAANRPASPAQPSRMTAPPPVDLVEEEIEHLAPEPKSFEIPVPAKKEQSVETSPRPVESRASTAVSRYQQTMKPNTNIYGEVIEAKVPDTTTISAAAAQRAKSLAAAVEKVVERRDKEAPIKTSFEAPGSLRAMARLKQVYEAAESMLRAGEGLRQVATKTSLPIEEVKRLSEIIKLESESSEITESDFYEMSVEASSEPAASTPSPAQDARLGVLSGMKRQVQTV